MWLTASTLSIALYGLLLLESANWAVSSPEELVGMSLDDVRQVLAESAYTQIPHEQRYLWRNDFQGECLELTIDQDKLPVVTGVTVHDALSVCSP